MEKRDVRVESLQQPEELHAYFERVHCAVSSELEFRLSMFLENSSKVERDDDEEEEEER